MKTTPFDGRCRLVDEVLLHMTPRTQTDAIEVGDVTADQLFVQRSRRGVLWYAAWAVREEVPLCVEVDVARPVDLHPASRGQLLAKAGEQVRKRGPRGLQHDVDVAALGNAAASDWLVRRRTSLEDRHLVERVREDAGSEQARDAGADHHCTPTTRRHPATIVPGNGF